MRLMVTLSAHFIHADGELYSSTISYDGLPARYLSAFDEVLLVARARPSADVPPGHHRVTGPGVRFVPLPDYVGPWQFLQVRGDINRAMAGAIDRSQAYLLRVPCDVGTQAWRQLRRRGLPFAVEVVGDPWQALAPGTVRSPARPIARRTSTRALRLQCRDAAAALYVTRRDLQEKYPVRPGALSVGCSDVELFPHMIAPDLDARLARLRELSQRSRTPGAPPVRLGFIGTFEVMYKAPDMHVRAAKLLRDQGWNIELAMLGGGRHLDNVRALATELGASDYVRFLGKLPSGGPVAAFLDSVDLFLIASRTEGLPRALIEAMARGCPAIGSRVGGIPELLEDGALVPAGDAHALAVAIAALLERPEAMAEAARRNWRVAQEYSDEILRPRRLEFYRAFRAGVETPSARGAAAPATPPPQAEGHAYAGTRPGN